MHAGHRGVGVLRAVLAGARAGGGRVELDRVVGLEDRLRVDGVAERVALLQRGHQREDLEGRAGLVAGDAGTAGDQRVHRVGVVAPDLLLGLLRIAGDLVLRVGRVVELEVPVHRHGADPAGARFDGGHHPGRLAALAELVADGLVGALLRLDVQRGDDRVAAALEPPLPVVRGGAERLLLEPPAVEVVAEEAPRAGGGLGAAVRGALALDLELDLLGGVRLLLVDRADLHHVVDDVVAPADRLGVARLGGRVERGGGLHHAGEHRRLLDVELARRLVEVDLAGRPDAVRAVAERGDVQVAPEDLVLGEFLVDLERQAHLAQLAAAGVLGRGDDVGRVGGRVGDGQPDVLHGERRRALPGGAGGLVVDEGPRHTVDVHAVVLVEVVVLGRDDGLLHVRRDVLELDVLAVLVVHRGQHGLAVGREQLGDLGCPGDCQLLGQRLERLRSGLGGQSGHRCHGEGRRSDHHSGQEAADQQRCGVGQHVVVTFPHPGHLDRVRE